MNDDSPGSPSVQVDALRGPSFSAARPRGSFVDCFSLDDPELLARSAGRQHGSFSCLSMLSDSPRTRGFVFREDSAQEDGSGGSDENDEGAAAGFSAGDDDDHVNSSRRASFDVAAARARDVANEEFEFGLSPSETIARLRCDSGNEGSLSDAMMHRGASPSGRSLSSSRSASRVGWAAPPRVVVVHPAEDDVTECDAASAGRKQRGSFNSLLLLEAAKLSHLGGDRGGAEEATEASIAEVRFPVEAAR